MKLFHLFLYLAIVFVAACKATAVIDPSLQKRFIGGGGEKQNVMISFTQSIQSVISQINSMSFTNDAEKRTALTDAQEAFTNVAQAPLKTFLNTMGVKSESFWINNKMVVQNADSRLINSISRIPGVAKIEKEPVINLEILRSVRQEEGEEGNSTDGLEWGIKKIHGSLETKGRALLSPPLILEYVHPMKPLRRTGDPNLGGLIPTWVYLALTT